MLTDLGKNDDDDINTNVMLLMLDFSDHQYPQTFQYHAPPSPLTDISLTLTETCPKQTTKRKTYFIFTLAITNSQCFVPVSLLLSFTDKHDSFV